MLIGMVLAELGGGLGAAIGGPVNGREFADKAVCDPVWVCRQHSDRDGASRLGILVLIGHEPKALLRRLNGRRSRAKAHDPTITKEL